MVGGPIGTAGHETANQLAKVGSFFLLSLDQNQPNLMQAKYNGYFERASWQVSQSGVQM